MTQTDERRLVRKGDIVWLLGNQVGAVDAYHIYDVSGEWRVNLIGHVAFESSLIPSVGVLTTAESDGCESRSLSVRLPG